MNLSKSGVVIDSRSTFAAARKRIEHDRVTKPGAFDKMLGNAGADRSGLNSKPTDAA